MGPLQNVETKYVPSKAVFQVGGGQRTYLGQVEIEHQFRFNSGPPPGGSGSKASGCNAGDLGFQSLGGKIP